MAKDPKPTNKSEVLSMRMDTRARFMLDLVARVRGQSITTVVDRAVQDAADKIRDRGYNIDWRAIWDVHEGVRYIKLLSTDAIPLSYEEENKLDFFRNHHVFFYIKNKNTILDHFVYVLWPRIDEFIEIWETTKSTDYFAATKAMQTAIKSAGLLAPEWPVKNPPMQLSDAIDDDAPF